MSRQVSLHKMFVGLCLMILAVFSATTGFAQVNQILQSQVSMMEAVALDGTTFNLNEVNRWPELTNQDITPCPLYPLDARVKGIEGRVILRCVINKNGKVQVAEIVEAMPEGVFDKCALALAQEYKFRPAMKNGKPVDCIAKVPIKFTIAKSQRYVKGIER